MRHFLLIAGLLTATTGCTSWKFNHTRNQQQTIDAEQISAIDLTTFNGAIRVAPHDKPTIEMDITYKAYGSTEAAAKENCEALTCEVTTEGSTANVKAVKPSGQWSSSIAFDLKTPPGCTLKLRTSNGQVTVQDIGADVEVTTSNGAINLQRVWGKQVASTSNGRIEIVDGTGSIRLSTSNGSVNYAGKLEGDQNEIHTSNGSVTVSVPPSELTEVIGKTSNGSIKCQMPMSIVSGDSKRSIHAMVGQTDQSQPSSKISITTSNGSIRVQPATVEVELTSPQPAESI